MSITDAQIRQLQDALFAGPADARQLSGLIACHDALGRSHRREKARVTCAAILQQIELEGRESSS